VKQRILVLGYFGYLNSQIDGQTIKTRNLYELLKSKSEEIGPINFFDTQSLQVGKLFIFKMFWMILLSNKLVYLPAHKNLKYIFPLVAVICMLKRIDIFYFVVGGWLAEYLKNKKLHVFLLGNIKGIFTESEQLFSSLSRDYKFSNITVFPNFRTHSFTPPLQQTQTSFKIVFMARINRMKGIEAVFNLAEHIEDNFDNNRPISIDFYGPIEPKEEVYFRDQVDKFTFVSYQCILEPDEIYNTLSRYDLMVLPTKYMTEGFPGSVLDAYISGLPVIVSNWKYAHEFVDEGETGFVYDLDNEEEFFSFVHKLFMDRKLLKDMKHNAFEKSKLYSSESAWNIIKNHFII
jgi:glycosyltransferase involved in cell wall biosynthesis